MMKLEKNVEQNNDILLDLGSDFEIAFSHRKTHHRVQSRQGLTILKIPLDSLNVMSNPWFTSHRPALSIKSSCSKTKRHDQIRYDLSKEYEDKMEKFEIMLKQQVKGKSK